MAKGGTKIDRIETQSAYEQALERLSGFFDARPASSSPGEEVFNKLLSIVESDEREHFPIPRPRQHDSNEAAVTTNEPYSVEGHIARVRELRKLYKGPPVTPEELEAAINYGRE